jgi:hypothetical protein
MGAGGSSKLQKTGIMAVDPTTNEMYAAVVDPDGNLHVEVQNVDPIPVTFTGDGATAVIDDDDVHVATITGTGDTALVNAGAGETVRIHLIEITNNDIPCLVEFRFGSGTYKHQTRLGSKGITIPLYFSPALEATAANTDFFGRADTASVDVDITVHAELVT